MKDETKKSVTFRMSDEEYRLLEMRAEENGSTVSQVARWLLFKQGGINITETRKNYLRPCTEMTCREYLKSFKNEVTLIGKSADKIMELKTINNDVFMQITIQEMLKNVIHSRDILSCAFSALNVPNDVTDELKKISIPQTLSELKTEIKKSKNNIKKYFYMQKISICGSIADTAETFSTENGTEMVNFTVVCDEKGDKTSYEVYVTKFRVADIVPLLTAKRQVFVTGNFKVRPAVTKSGTTQNPLSISADSVTLGMEVLS